mgnify:CR=1 FL=1
MKTLTAIVTVIVVIAIVLGVSGLLLNLQGIVPKPEQYAAATATVLAAQAKATRYSGETNATATVAAAYVQARQTAVPSEVATQNQNEGARNYVLTGGILGAIIVLVLIGLGIAMITRRESQTISRDETGQLPGFVDRGTIVNLQAVPAFALPTNDTPAQLIGGWTPENLLTAFIAALQPTVLAALMRPGQTDPQKQGRVEILRKSAITNPYGMMTAPATVTIIGDGQVAQQLAERAGLELPALPREQARIAAHIQPNQSQLYEIQPPTPLELLEPSDAGNENGD